MFSERKAMGRSWFLVEYVSSTAVFDIQDRVWSENQSHPEFRFVVAMSLLEGEMAQEPLF